MSELENKINSLSLEEIEALEVVSEPEVNNIETDPTKSFDKEVQPTITEGLNKEDFIEVANEIEKDRVASEFPITTAVSSFLDNVTLGLSTKALVDSGTISPTDLARLERVNSKSSMIGTGLGLGASVLATGGAGAAANTAKGVKALKGGAALLPTSLAIRAGQGLETITSAGLKKIIKDTGRKKLATQIIQKSIPLAVGSAVEGALFSTGELISEDALGRAELNSEFISRASMGALLGGAVGGIFGTIPVLHKAGKDFKVKTRKGIAGNVDNAFKDFVELKGAKEQRILNRNPDFIKQGRELLTREDRINLKFLDSSEALNRKSLETIDKIGDEIGSTVKKVDSIDGIEKVLPTEGDIAINRLNKLKEIENQITLGGKKSSGSVRAQLKVINKEKRILTKQLKSNKTLKASDLRELKSSFQKDGKYGKKGVDLLTDTRAYIARENAHIYKQELLNVADRVSNVDVDLGTTLRKLNQEYGAAIDLQSLLEKKFIKSQSQKSFLGLKDMLFGIASSNMGLRKLAAVSIGVKKAAQSDAVRKLRIMIAVEDAKKVAEKTINNSAKNYFSKEFKTKALRTGATAALVNFGFAFPIDKPKTKSNRPKDKLEAIKNIQDNMQKISENPEIMVNIVQSLSSNIEDTVPNTASNLGINMARALNFIQEKLPRDPSASNMMGLAKRPFQPSEIEISKFERYIDAINDPFTILEDLESNSLTPETVEAVSRIYPETYNEIIQKYIAEAQASTEDIPYSKRLQIGLLTGSATDPSLTSSSILGLQQQFVNEQEQLENAKQQTSNRNGAINSTVGGFKNIEAGERTKANNERLLTRK